MEYLGMCFIRGRNYFFIFAAYPVTVIFSIHIISRIFICVVSTLLFKIISPGNNFRKIGKSGINQYSNIINEFLFIYIAIAPDKTFLADKKIMRQ